ncbi:MAG: tRNA 4-thiouridine(8) synthase ThiI [Planctomycetes bacterium]|nr:tRNA 4-thiouridine(8) synthase ThiI [Planctomycetota bacterium]MBI3846273.1 tRNA 4-thiouridine(8) synthase ThiI [Planctomycetota bacterium]
MADTLLVHYGEVGIKGQNRPYFERRLMSSVSVVGGSMGVRHVRREPGRLAADIAEGVDADAIARRISEIPGVAWCAVAATHPPDVEAISRAVVELAKAAPPGSFRIESRRADKGLPFRSVDLNRQVGAAVVAATGRPVDLEKAPLVFRIEADRHRFYLFTERIDGPGGLPVGVSGKVIALLSGGLDSPVAAWRMIRRGCRVVCCHFFNPAAGAGAGVREKIDGIVRVLARAQGPTRVYLVPFERIQREIVSSVPASHRMLVYRRAMFRVADRILFRERALALVTGDSVGQVASQTLANMRVIHAATHNPVLTPLAGDDKKDIVAQARRIGTFETSILPYGDCCSFLIAPQPETRGSLEDIVRMEAAIEFEPLVAEAESTAERLLVVANEESAPARPV